MKIRAAVLEEFGAPLVVQEVDLDGPQAGEVLVRLHACGVCHTDMYTASGVDPSGYAPCVLGHEGAGVVEEIGPDVTSLKKGDHVVTLFSPQCRECVHCLSPKTNICLKIRDQQGKGYLPDGTTRLSKDGEPIRHFMGTSTFAEATVMPEIALAKINPEAPLDRACLFACGLSTGLGAAMNTAKVEAGSTCVVFGAGMVGLGAVAGARLMGAERIVCVDLSEDRLALAKGQGATDTFVGGPDAVAQVLEMTGGFGADYTFEATGNVKVMAQAVEAARMGWGLCTVTGVAGQGRDPRRDPALAHHGPPDRGLELRRGQGPRPGPAAGPALPRRGHRRRRVPLAPHHARRGQQGLRPHARPGRDPLGHRARVGSGAMRKLAKAFAGPFMLTAGINHFVNPKVYEQIMPDYLPAHRELVYASGVTEILGGAMSMVPATRRWGGWMHVMTLLGVTPAHIHMLQHQDRYKKIPAWALWARLPLQVAMLGLVWKATLAPDA